MNQATWTVDDTGYWHGVCEECDTDHRGYMPGSDDAAGRCADAILYKFLRQYEADGDTERAEHVRGLITKIEQQKRSLLANMAYRLGLPAPVFPE